MEQKILETFLYNNKLKFNEIEKLTKIRSNKLSYYLKKLEKRSILTKEKNFYKLSETAEHLIPYLSDKKAVLTIVLIALEKNRRIFLYNRQKRPFKDKLSLPGGRLLTKESVSDCVKRIMKQKHNINVELKKINSISLEHVKDNDKIVHSFLLTFVTAKTRDKINYIDIEKNKPKIISSDYKLLKNDLDKKININTFITK